MTIGGSGLTGNVSLIVQADLKFGIKMNVDIVFASFIRKAQDILDIRKELGEEGKHIFIVSKVRVHVHFYWKSQTKKSIKSGQCL